MMFYYITIFGLVEKNLPNTKSPHSILHCLDFLTDTAYMSYGEIHIDNNTECNSVLMKAQSIRVLKDSEARRPKANAFLEWKVLKNLRY